MVWPLLVGLGLAAVAIGGKAARQSYVRFQARGGFRGGPKEFYKGGFQAKLDRREAALILGVRQSAERDLILKRWRTLAKVNHPDRGGSPFVQSKINDAKDELLKSKFRGGSGGSAPDPSP